MTHLLIAAAGGLGSWLRYLVSLALSQGSGLQLGTLVVNLVGSFLLAIVAEALRGQTLAGTDLRLVLGVGLLGGFTTYSSFNLELLRMLEGGAFGRALGYFAVTIGGCLVGAAIGVMMVRFALPR